MTGEGTTSRRLGAKSLRWTALATGLVVAVATIAAESVRSPGGTRQIGIQAAAPSVVASTTSTTTFQPRPCVAPPLPAATNPPGSVYGIPFVAQLTAELKGGYDLQRAAQHLDPWRADISNITGYAAGLLQVPALTGVVTTLKLCYQGDKPPANPGDRGGAIIVLINPPPSPPTTNVGHCIGSSSTPGYRDMRVTITPDPNLPTTLSVTGVEANGTLDLTGTQAVTTSIFNDDCPGINKQTCVQFGPADGVAPTLLTFSTKVTPPPPGAPPGVVYPFTPQPMQGQIDQATATLVGNSFAVPAFKDASQSNGCFFSAALNASLAGFDATGTTRYNYGPPQAVIAGDPGWNQFKASTQILQLGP